MRAGIVGLPNVGKSTLFNALTSSKTAQAANYPFCTIEPNEGVVSVPDDRLAPDQTSTSSPRSWYPPPSGSSILPASSKAPAKAKG